MLKQTFLILALFSSVNLYAQIIQFEKEKFNNPAHQPTFGVTQEESPLELMWLKTDFIPSKFLNSLSDVGLNKAEYSRGVYVDIEVKNVSQKRILGYSVGFLSFSLFDEFISFEIAYSGVLEKFLYPEAVIKNLPETARKANQAADEDDKLKCNHKAKWRFIYLNDHTHYTGIAFVDRVRFEDGTIWKADRAIIARYVSELFGDFRNRSINRD